MIQPSSIDTKGLLKVSMELMWRLKPKWDFCQEISRSEVTTKLTTKDMEPISNSVVQRKMA